LLGVIPYISDNIVSVWFGKYAMDGLSFYRD
jgi:hypothetical protein